MLLNNFFILENIEILEDQIIGKILIDANHEILKGHFPQQALVPGVCMLEMLKELLQKHFDKKLMMTESSVIKFLTMFSIPQYTRATFYIDSKILDNGNYSIQASLKNEEHIFLKFKGIFQEK